MPKRLAMVASGRGSTVKQILQSCASGGKLYGLIEPKLLVVTNRNSKSLEVGLHQGLNHNDTMLLPYTDFDPTRWASILLEACEKRSIDLIGLYGCNVLIPELVTKYYSGRMVNQHPGPIRPGKPDFGGPGMVGLAVHASVLFFARSIQREFFTEATAQSVSKEFDQGIVLKQKRVRILRTDDVLSLQARVKKVEYEVQIETLLDLANDTLTPPELEAVVLPGEEDLLERSKDIGRTLFPRG